MVFKTENTVWVIFFLNGVANTEPVPLKYTLIISIREKLTALLRFIYCYFLDLGKT